MKIHFIVATTVLAGCLTTSASAVTWDFGQVHVSASDAPSGAAPWATLTFVQNGAGVVDFTLTHNSASAAGQFLRNLYLNIVPFVGGITMTELDETQANIVGMSTGSNAFGHASATGFDMLIEFQNSGGAGRLNPNESVSWRASGTGLTTGHFEAFSSGANPAMGLIHLQGIPGGFSSHIEVNAVPEPATMVGLAVLGGCVARRLRRRA